LPIPEIVGQIQEAWAKLKPNAKAPTGLDADLAKAQPSYPDWKSGIEAVSTIEKLFGADNVWSELARVKNDECGVSFHARAVELFVRIEGGFNLTVDLPRLYQDLNPNFQTAEGAIRDGLDGVVTSVCAFLSAIYPAARKLDIGNFIRILSWFQNVFLWGFGFWGGCVSLGSYFGMIGMVVVVLELWLRRVGMMARDELTVKTTYSYSEDGGTPAPVAVVA
jgi:hypothetical protein